MADESQEITVATYEQIVTILSKLAVNYSNMASKFYDIFYSTTAQDIQVQLYDASGTLQTYTIPNRAKDFTYILNGSGTPEGSKTASVGSIYQDTTNGKLYIKELGTGVTGWVQIYAGQEILHGSGSPEGVYVAEIGKMYVDDTNGALYIKASTSSTSQAEGWNLISANTSALVNKDLSNLSTTGEDHFANPSLSNLSSAGLALFSVKEDTSNKVVTIESSSTDTQYPSAKATYVYSEYVRSDRADRNLSNLTSTGEYKVLPSHTGNSGKALFSNGVYGVWTNLSTTYAEVDLSNLDSTGQAVLTAKESKSNKVTSISSSSTDTQYPSAKATYTYAEAVRSDRANKDLSNLSSTGNSKFQVPVTGGASTITTSNLTASRALISNTSGKVAVSDVTSTELGYLDGVTSAIQTQLNAKLNTSDKTTIIGWGMPNYSAGVSITVNTDYTCTASGWVLVYRYTDYESQSDFYLNGTQYKWAYRGGNYDDANFAMIPVSSGDTVKLTLGTIIFYPMKGA